MIRQLALRASLGAALIVAASSATVAQGLNFPGPSTTSVSVSPSDGLADSQTVQVSGSGFQANQEIHINECGDVQPNNSTSPVCRAEYTSVDSDADGNFGPVAFNVTRIIVGGRRVHGKEEPATHECAPADDCYVLAFSATKAVRSAAQQLSFTP